MIFVKRHLMKPGAIVVECGAHHGAQTILLSRWAGDTGRVIAVEPNPGNLVILKRNTEINGLTNVTVVEKAAGATCDPVYMNASSNGSVRSGGSLKVDGITVDHLALDLGMKPTFVKIDVEGYEYQVLEGCKSVLFDESVLSSSKFTPCRCRAMARNLKIFGISSILITMTYSFRPTSVKNPSATLRALSRMAGSIYSSNRMGWN